MTSSSTLTALSFQCTYKTSQLLEYGDNLTGAKGWGEVKHRAQGVYRNSYVNCNQPYSFKLYNHNFRPTPRTTTTFNSPGGRIYPAKSEPDLTSETATYRSSAHQRAQTQHVPITPRAQTQHAPITRATNRVPRSRSPPPVKPVSTQSVYVSAFILYLIIYCFLCLF